MIKKIHNLNSVTLLIISLGVLFAYFAPIIVLGENSYHGVHDNLDSNHINSVISAENMAEFGSNAETTPQLMGGLPRTPGPNLGIKSSLYRIFHRYNALLINILLVHLTAFFGMLILLRHLNKESFETNRTIYFLAALAFGIIRFWANAGISVAGLPLLYFGYLIAKDRKVIALLIAFFYAFYSNFVLVGMFALIVLGIMEISSSLRSKRINWYRWAFLLLVFFFYLVSSYQLVLSVFSPHPLFVSHRLDYNMSSFYSSWGKAIRLIPTLIFRSYGHNSGFPLLPMLSSLAVIIICRIRRCKDQRMEGTFLTIIGLSLLSALLSTQSWMGIQQHIPIFKMVQLQRFYWLLVFLQYLLFFFALLRLTKLNLKRTALALAVLQILILFAWNVNYKQMVKKHLFGMEVNKTYAEFYSPELMQQVQEYISKPQSSYRVVSVGLEPAVALYSGFYSVEGYSGSYPIEHKRRMRAVMAAELDKNEYLANNFDGWGNKVTIYSDDIDKKIGYPSPWDIPMISKNEEETIDNLVINTSGLKDMNCQYLFSTLEITNYQETGLEFLRSFENSKSLYRIYLYQIE
ncbi:MAG: DUF6044 family protein [Candidatus Cloacimonetes bacterium]|nr:DUF6044 family protein [Candidatus Cloacimonadota bacterium]